MDPQIVTALISIIPTVIVALFSIASNNQVILTKIENLKEQVEKHNKVIERVYDLEARVDVLEEKNK